LCIHRSENGDSRFVLSPSVNPYTAQYRINSAFAFCRIQAVYRRRVKGQSVASLLYTGMIANGVAWGVMINSGERGYPAS